MKKIKNLEEIRKIQMDILSFVDNLCRVNGLNYSLSGGSLIGAVRHGGYIPWDDDIDILMKREDLDKLINIFTNEQQGYYSLLYWKKCKKYTLPFVKIMDKRTFLVEPGVNFDLGINIDVFPFDFIDEDFTKSMKTIDKVKFLKNIYVVKHLIWDQERSIFKNLLIYLCKIPLYLVPSLMITSAIDNIARKAAKANSPKRACLVWGYGSKEIMPSSIFEEYDDIQFENRTFMSLRNKEVYLSNLFGDYMKLPPVEQRKTHHEYYAFWR